MAFKKNLLLKLLLIINNRYTEDDLRDLITAMVEELLPVIKKNQGWHLYLSNYEPRDIAYLAVSNIFIRNSQGRFPVLERLFNWKTLEKFLSSSEEDFHRFLRNVLLRRLKQTYHYLSNEITPERNKIKREIIYALKKTPHFKIKKDKNNPRIIFQPQGQATINYTDEIDGLVHLCLENRLGGLQIPKFFSRLAEILERQTTRLEIPLNSLYNLYVSVQKHYLMAEVASEFKPDFRYLVYDSNKNIQTWIKELKTYGNYQIEKYVRKRKIAPEEKERWMLAFQDLIKDWQDGGQEESFYNYLKRYLPDLSPEDYRQNKRKIFEYLVKSTREFLKEKLKNNHLSE